MVLVLGLSSSYSLRKLLPLGVEIDYFVPQNFYLYMTPHVVGFMSAKRPRGALHPKVLGYIYWLVRRQC